MNTLEAIFNRRSIRKYTTASVTDEQLSIILRCAMYAPSAVNKQPWHFIVFRDKTTINRIVEVHPNASMLLNADAAILVCWDESLAHDAGYGPVDCSAATQNMLLAAYELGLGAVWVGIYPRPNRINEMKKIFDLPAHIHGFSIVSIGYPAEKRNVPERYNLSRIHYEKW